MISLATFTIPGTSFEVPPELILGVVTGLTYSLMGMGLTLVYRSSRVLNFAHGQMGATVALLVPLLVINHGVNYWVSLLAAMAAAVALGALIETRVIRKLERAPRLVMLVATIGISQLLYVVQAFIPKGRLGTSSFPVPFSWSFTIGGVVLGPGEIMILIFVPLLAIGLSAFLRRTRVGLASRAAAENIDAARLAGVPVHRASLAIWIVAALFAGLGTILVGPTKPITDGTIGHDLILRGLAAAMLGGLVSLRLSFLGGIAVGVIEFLVVWNYPTGGVLEVVLFILIAGSFLLRKSLGQIARGGEGSSWSFGGAVRPLNPRILALPRIRKIRRGTLGAVLAAAILVPLVLNNSQRILMASVVIYGMIGLSLTVLTGYAGQISLGQFAFVGIGAIVGGRMQQLGYPSGAALVWAIIAGGIAAVMVGLPALRVRGLFLAVTTLAFALASIFWLTNQDWLVQTVADESSLQIRRPKFLGVDFQRPLNYYWLCLAVLALTATAVWHLRRTGVGRRILAVRDNEPAAATLSVDPRRAKLTAFVLSGMIASMAGYFFGGMLVQFGAQTTTIFGPAESLTVMSMAVLGGVTTVTGVLWGAFFLKTFEYWFAPLVGSTAGPRFSVLLAGYAVLSTVLYYPQGAAAWVFERRDRWFERLAKGTVEPEPAGDMSTRPALPPASPAAAPEPSASSAPAIEARDILVRFGGIVAVDRVSITAAEGEIVGLIGPNGAGKTTLFDVLSGQLRPTEGRVLLDGRDITKLRPEERAKLGLGRTFQEARLFEELSVTDVFKLALESQEPSEIVPSLLGLPPSRAAERAKSMRAHEVVEMLGLGVYAYRHIGELSTGTRRFVELGCMIAMGAPVLLLDEPTAGIAQREVEAFRPVLREVRDHLGATMILIDHDIPMMMGLVDRVYALASGQIIAEGTPEQVRDDPTVIASYLGSDERLIRRSGSVAAAVERLVTS